MIARLPAVVALLVSMLLGSGAAHATLTTSHTDTTGDGAAVDGMLSADEYGPGNAYVYAGGGGGFGGTLGGAAAKLYIESDATNIYFGFQPGATLDNNVVIHLDTQAGGVTDAQMNDTGDAGRNVVSNLTRDVDDVFPVGILPDYGIVIGDFGIVTFGLNAGNTPNHLSFVDFNGTFSGQNTAFREYTLPLSSVGNPSAVNFFVSYVSNTNFMSNESMPAEAYNVLGNPGFDNGGVPLTHTNYHQFLIAVPEARGWVLMGLVTSVVLGACVVSRRRARDSRLPLGQA